MNNLYLKKFKEKYIVDAFNIFLFITFLTLLITPSQVKSQCAAVNVSLPGSAATAGITSYDANGYITTGKKNCWYTGGSNPPSGNGSAIPDVSDIGMSNTSSGFLTIPGHVNTYSGLTYTYTTNNTPACGGSFFVIDASTIGSATPSIGCSGRNNGGNPYSSPNNVPVQPAYASGIGGTQLVFNGNTYVAFYDGGMNYNAFIVSTRFKITATGAGLWALNGTKYYLKIPANTTFSVNVLVETDGGSGWTNGYFANNTEQAQCPYQTCNTLGSLGSGNYVGINYMFYSQHSGNNGYVFQTEWGRIYNAFNPTFEKDVTGPSTPSSPTVSPAWVGDHCVTGDFTINAPGGATDPVLGSGMQGYELCRSLDDAGGCSVWVTPASITNSAVSVTSANGDVPSPNTFRYYSWYPYDLCNNQGTPSTDYVRMAPAPPTLVVTNSCGSPVLTASGLVSGATLLWSDGSTAASPRTVGAGSFWVKQLGVASCTSLQSNTVTAVIGSVPTANAGTAQTVCQGGSITLAGTIGGSATSSTWSAPSGGFSNTASLTSTYTPSITSGTVTLTLTTDDPDGAGPCSAATSTVVITVNPAATANAGTAQSICFGGTITLAGSIGGSASSSTWSAGSGIFSDATLLSSTYTPSISSGTVTLTLTTNDPDGAGSCTAATSNVVINVTSAATANAGFPQTVCQGGAVTLAGSIGGGAISSTWSAPSGSFSNTTLLNSTYTPSISSGTVTLTLTTNDPDGAGPCSAATSTVVITVNPAATASAGLPQTVCGGGTITLAGNLGGSASNSTWSSGTGSFSNASSLTSTYTPSISSGTVSLTLTTNDPDGAGPCSAANSIVVITVNLAATANAGVAQTICQGGTITLSGSIAGGASGSTWSAASGSFSDINSLGSTYTPSITSGTITLTLTTNDPDGVGPCSAATSTVVITVNPVATAYAGTPQTVCQGGAVTLAGNTGGSASSSTWTALTGAFSNINSLTSTYTPSIVSGDVTLTLTTNDPDGVGPCQSATSNVVITVTPLPDINSVVRTNVLCFGGSTGSITITATSGTPPLSYSIDNGINFQSSNVFNNLAIGSYNVIVKDVQTCSKTYSLNPVVVGQPLALSHTTTVVDASCANVFDGSITVTTSGGLAPYSYSLNGGSSQPGNVFSGLSSGTYVVLVTDANGCTSSSTVTINDTYGIAGSIQSQTPVSCFGGVDGSVTVQLTQFGVSPYTYSINGVIFQPSSTFVGLASGNYIVFIRDSKGCTAFVPVTITQPSILQAQLDAVGNILCSGGSTGSIAITVTGGNPGYSFLWSNGTTTEDITGLTSGTYNVAITDSKGCSASVGATISQPLPLFLNIASYHDLKCFNDSSGSIDITVSGGVPPYNFSWSNGAATEDVLNLKVNTYSVTVTDNNGCQQNISQNIAEPLLLTSSAVVTNLTCTSSIDLSVNGGSSPYSYLWNNGSTVQDLSGITTGNYIVVITDAHGCATSNTSIVTPSNGLALSTVVTNVLCNGNSTGAIDLTVTGGTGSYSYSWTGGATTQDLSNLAVGSYSVTVTDGNCSATISANVTQPAGLVLNATTTNAGCAGGANGSIAITVNGGVFPYSYLWSNGATTENVNGLIAGIYAVTVKDANNCTIVQSFTITEPGVITSSVVGTNVTCHGASNGAANLTVGGGSAPYTYLWSNFQSTQDLTNIGGGQYFVIIKDANACEKRDSILITEPAALALSTTVTNVLCHGAATGAIDLSVTSGSGTYTYSWTGGATTQDITGLSAGTYSVTVTDGNSCTASTGATITQPAGLVLNATATNVGCSGGANGSVDITVQGGVFPYSFVWSNGTTTEDINGLSGNNYGVTVTDANVCSLTATYIISEPSAITSSIVGTNVTCHGASNGAANLTVGGGTAPYTYLWSNFQSTQDLTNISGGQYFVIIKDANACEKRDSIIITELLALNLSTVVTNVQCHGASTGAIDLTVSGGSGSYTYVWTGGATSQDVSGLTASTYSVTVTDGNNCTAITSATVTQPAGMVLNATTTNVGCAGGANGSIDITVQGGVFPYSFVWSNLATTEDINGLSGNAYGVTVTDANSCTLTATFTVTEPSALSATATGTNVTCHGMNNGHVTLTVAGGVSPYNYVWTNGATTQNINNLGSGMYTVVVHDVNGCSSVASANIAEPSAIILSTSVTNVLCNGNATGIINLTATGGTSTFDFTWSNGANTQNLTNVIAGTYSVTVKDVNNCTAATSATITQSGQLILTGTATNVHCFGGNDALINTTVTGGTPSYTFVWSNGANTEDIQYLTAGNYSLTVTDAHACVTTASYTINSPAPITSSIVGVNVLCHASNSGSADLTVSGGITPYSYFWSNFQISEDVANLGGGIYFVVITDASGCTHRDSVIIQEPSPLVLSTAVTQINCFNANNGAIDLTVAGGDPTYHYNWSNGAIVEDLSNLAGANYTVTVTDNHNCTASISTVIINPSNISTNVVTHNPLCFSETNGSIDLIATGGTPNYSFAWSTGALTEDISNIGAGVYTITITDAHTCVMVDSFVITEPGALFTSGFTKNVTCFGLSDGFVDITGYGGTLPYSYLWSTGQSTEDIGNLSGPSYFVTVTDFHGCSVVSLYLVTEPLPLTVNIAGTNATCFGSATGTLTSLPSGGSRPYEYVWDDFATDSVRVGVTAGHYVLLLTDSNNCHTFDSIDITQPTEIQIAGTVTNAHCFGTATGAVDVSVSGGTPTYLYAWTSGATTQDVSTLVAGNYTVTVTDLIGCQNTSLFSVTQPLPILLHFFTQLPSCFGSSNGAISVDADQGLAPYTYTWNTTPPQNSEEITGLSAGNYVVNVTDANSCTVTTTKTLTQPSKVELTLDTYNPKCYNTSTGMVIVNVTGGVSPFIYTLNNLSQVSDTFVGLGPGNYSVVAEDINGCKGIASFQNSSPGPISVDLGVTQQVILTGMETQLVATGTSTSPIIGYFWNPDSLFNFINCSDPNVCSAPYVHPRTTTTFMVTIMNADSCMASDTITVIVNDHYSQFIPTAFTPNGDNLNDRLEFDILGATTLDVSVFNRWGQKIYYNPTQPNGITGQNGWDGNVDGKQSPSDTYIYKMRITFYDGTTKNETGTINIIR